MFNVFDTYTRVLCKRKLFIFSFESIFYRCKTIIVKSKKEKGNIPKPVRVARTLVLVMQVDVYTINRFHNKNRFFFLSKLTFRIIAGLYARVLPFRRNKTEQPPKRLARNLRTSENTRRIVWLTTVVHTVTEVLGASDAHA